MLDAVASRDCDRILDQCAPGFVFEFPMFGQPIDDYDLFRTDIGPGLALLEGLSFHDVVVDEMLDASEVTLRYTGTATMATTGKPYRQTYITQIRVEDGRVMRYREYFDRAVIMEAMTPDTTATP